MTLVGISENFSQARRVASWSLRAVPDAPEDFFAVPAHEREIERPPGQPHHRHPAQLLLEEELEQGNAPRQQVLQNQDVGPGLVVAVDQIPAARIEPVDPLDVPVTFWVSAIQPLLQTIQASAIRTRSGSRRRRTAWNGRISLKRHEDQDRHPEQRVERQQQESDQADQRRRQEIEHRCERQAA
jgi:hypothetical protein